MSGPTQNHLLCTRFAALAGSIRKLHIPTKSLAKPLGGFAGTSGANVAIVNLQYWNRFALYVFLAIFACALSTGCSRQSENAKPQHRYTLTGKVVAINPQDQTATIAAAAIPNFMEAMTMPYPIRSRQEFDLLHVGDRITATVNVFSDGVYNLSDIKVQR